MAMVVSLFFKHKESPYVKKPMQVMNPVVAGLIISAARMMCNSDSFSSYISVIIFVATVVAHYFFKVNPILLIVAAGVVGWLCG